MAAPRWSLVRFLRLKPWMSSFHGRHEGQVTKFGPTFNPVVSMPRPLHTSPCRAKRNYYFISPYPRREPIKDEPRTEVIECKEDFKHVERLLPTLQIPQPPEHKVYPTPSGWSPPKGASADTPYRVKRTRFHAVPVYLETRSSNQHWTVIKHVRGDIWTLATDLQHYLEEQEGKAIPVTVNEYAMRIRYKGLYEDKARQWLEEKGF
ncbi:large ribosomal subunit protein mL49-like [Diadema antillarum]|uniref:large ribosomal subunit protein mL49-like n=1 Tax=Diadema antillarum TaxID=105358 RepID=UPI003A8946BD